MPRSAPAGWYHIEPMGQVVRGTRFIPFKVPLGGNLDKNIDQRERFSPLMAAQRYPRMRIIIDLTNTDRYYQSEEFTNLGINWIKFPIPGRQMPPESFVRRFFDLVDNFMRSEDSEEYYVGVHCTHGVNRTGYFICRYMIERMGYKPMQAISMFQSARGICMDKHYLLDDLMTRVPEKRIKMRPPKHDFTQHSSLFHNSHETPGPMRGLPPPEIMMSSARKNESYEGRVRESRWKASEPSSASSTAASLDSSMWPSLTTHTSNHRNSAKGVTGMRGPAPMEPSLPINPPDSKRPSGRMGPPSHMRSTDSKTLPGRMTPSSRVRSSSRMYQSDHAHSPRRGGSSGYVGRSDNICHSGSISSRGRARPMGSHPHVEFPPDRGPSRMAAPRNRLKGSPKRQNPKKSLPLNPRLKQDNSNRWKPGNHHNNKPTYTRI